MAAGVKDYLTNDMLIYLDVIIIYPLSPSLYFLSVIIIISHNLTGDRDCGRPVSAVTLSSSLVPLNCMASKQIRENEEPRAELDSH